MPVAPASRRAVAKAYRGMAMEKAREMKQTSTSQGLASFIRITRRIQRQILNKKE